MKEFTSKEFKEALNTSDTETYGLLSYMERVGAIKRVGERKRPDGKGKPSVVYAVVEGGIMTLGRSLTPILEP